MMKIIKQIAVVLVALVLSVGFTGCEEDDGGSVSDNTSNTSSAGTSDKTGYVENTDRVNYTKTLKIYNASEYIDMTTIADFEKEFSVRVDYVEFESNEDMYGELSANPGAYDILIPSDYMIDRLVKEGSLEKIDKTKIENIANIAEEYLNPAYDAANDYVVPYMTGTLGILYNKKYVNGTVDSWNSLFEPQYQGKVLMVDSVRDSLGATLKMLGFSLNSGDENELAQVKTKLQEARSRFDYNESEIVRDKMVAGEGILGIVYSGDAKMAVDRNPNLAYIIPKEGSNKWVDGFVIVKGTQNLEEAHQFINFMCRSNIAVRNMTKIGYTSPVRGAWSEFGSNNIMFPSEEDLNRCEAFLYDAQAAEKYANLWKEIH